jgi:plastocyanin
MAAAALSLTVLGCAKDETTTTSAAVPDSTTTPAAVNSGEVVEITSVGGKFAFEPDTKEVKVNEAVIWRNKDATKHTVTAKSGQDVSFKSPTMATDAEFIQTFPNPGEYAYFCSIHGEEKMSGTITVSL